MARVSGVKEGLMSAAIVISAMTSVAQAVPLLHAFCNTVYCKSFEVEKFRGFRGLTGDRETFPVKDFPTGNLKKKWSPTLYSRKGDCNSNTAACMLDSTPMGYH